MKIVARCLVLMYFTFFVKQIKYKLHILWHQYVSVYEVFVLYLECVVNVCLTRVDCVSLQDALNEPYIRVVTKEKNHYIL